MKLDAWPASAGDLLEAALHPLVDAVGLVFARFQMGVGAQPFARPVHVEIERDARGQLLGAFGQLALEGGIAVDLFLPRGEAFVPRLVAGKELDRSQVSDALTSLRSGSFFTVGSSRVRQRPARPRPNGRQSRPRRSIRLSEENCGDP